MAVIVAGGGDGTINQVASRLLDSEVSLGVLPMGTLNHFAKDMGIPLELDQAIAVIATSRARLIDVGEVNGRLFLNNSSIGLYPDVVHEREHQQQRLGRGKWLAFGSACVSALRRFPFLRVRLTTMARFRDARHSFHRNNESRFQGWISAAALGSIPGR